MQSYATQVSFLNSLEGLRAVAALAIVLTHTAFQTGMHPASFVGGVLARFDFFVAVFFALSAFVLWRRWGVAASEKRRFRNYYRSRAARILPGYVVFVLCVLLVFPDAYGASPVAVLANLTLTQIYLPHALLPGLTHLWSLCVEAAFYVVLPVVVWVLSCVPRQWRIPLIIGGALLSLGWAFVPFVAASPAPGVANMQIFPPGFSCWFAVGMVAAEVEGRVPVSWFRHRIGWWCVSVAALILAAQPFFGPLGLAHPSPEEFMCRVVAGTVFAAGVVVPIALAPAPHSVLSTPVMRALGRWSYGIFLWHLPVLGFVFPLLGVAPFSGNFVVVSCVTIALTIPISAAAHTLIENPMKNLLSANKTNAF